MKQMRLTDLEKPPKPKVFNCWTCTIRHEILMINGKQKVKCPVKGGVTDFPSAYCTGWTDGSDPWPALPEELLPRPERRGIIG